jgi:5-methylcytosine-specific restriction endonuclease McrA
VEIVGRQEALAKGIPRYFTGKPCIHGHISERLTNARVCIACHSIAGAANYAKRRISDPKFAERHDDRARAWKKDNRDKKNAQATRWRINNPDKISGYNLQWREKNPDKAKANNDRWRTNNREKCRQAVKDWEARNPKHASIVKAVCKSNRRARVAQNGGHASADDIQRLFDLQRGKCANCHKKHPRMEVDHIRAISRGGSSDPSNLQLLCMPCNRRKSSKDEIAWAREHGRLL